MAGVARIGAVEVLDVIHPGAIGVALPAPGLVLVDLLDAHRLEHARLLGTVEPHVQRAGPVAQHDRAGAAQHDDVALVGGLDQETLGLAAERVGGGLGQDHAARIGQTGQQPREPRRSGFVVNVGVLDRDGQALGHLHGDRAVDEPAPEPLSHLRADPAAAGAVRGGDRDHRAHAATGAGSASPAVARATPGRSKDPETRAPRRKMPAAHQNATV